MVYYINAIDKRYIYQLMSNVQIIGSKRFNSHIIINYCIQNNGVDLAKQFQNNLYMYHRKHVIIDQ